VGTLQYEFCGFIPCNLRNPIHLRFCSFVWITDDADGWDFADFWASGSVKLLRFRYSLLSKPHGFFVFMVDVQVLLVGEHQQRQKKVEFDNCQMTPDQFKKTVFLLNKFDVGNATILF
jgi:hypothetical protein